MIRQMPALPPYSPYAREARSGLSPPSRYCEYFSNVSKATKKLTAIFASLGNLIGAGLRFVPRNKPRQILSRRYLNRQPELALAEMKP
jgi:hypothetical protein